jgi:hypothetical protein
VPPEGPKRPGVEGPRPLVRDLAHYQIPALAFHVRDQVCLPTWPHWLIVARHMLDPNEVKYFVSNAPAGTPLEAMLFVGFQRYHVESCFEEEKGELGMDHFEVRNYASLKRHLTLTAVSHLFLANVRQKWRGEKSASDGLPTPPGGRGTGAVVVADGPHSHELPEDGGRDHHRDTAA